MLARGRSSRRRPRCRYDSTIGLVAPAGLRHGAPRRHDTARAPESDLVWDAAHGAVLRSNLGAPRSVSKANATARLRARLEPSRRRTTTYEALLLASCDAHHEARRFEGYSVLDDLVSAWVAERLLRRLRRTNSSTSARPRRRRRRPRLRVDALAVHDISAPFDHVGGLFCARVALPRPPRPLAHSIPTPSAHRAPSSCSPCPRLGRPLARRRGTLRLAPYSLRF